MVFNRLKIVNNNSTFLNMQNHNRIILIVFIHLTFLTFISCQNCHSTCLTCSSYGINSCLSCSHPLTINGTSCVPSNSITILEVVDSSWNSNLTTYLNNIENSIAQYQSSTAANWLPNGYEIYDYRFLVLGITGSSAFNSIELRYSLQQNLTSKCNSTLITVGTNPPTGTPIQLLSNSSSNYSVPSYSVPSQFINSNMKVIIFQSNGSCSFNFFVRDVSVIITTTLACSPPCSTCEGIDSNCTSCGLDQNGNQAYMSSDNLCNSTCPVGYFPSNANFTCDNCNLACLSCFGSLDSQCTQCNNSGGYYILNSSNNTCQVCQPSEVAVGNPLTCTACDAGCSSCENTTNFCLSCSQYYYLFNNTCLSSCPYYYFTNLANNTCTACYTGCMICTDANATSCIRCGVDENGTQYYLESLTSRCLTQCGISFYQGVAQPYKQCDSCAVGCYNCSIVNDSTACRACINSDGYYFTANSSSTCLICVGLVVNLTCAPCSGCRTCAGVETNCTSCDNGTYLTHLFTCSVACPNFYFINSSAWICQSCSTGCLTCSGALSNQCSSCGNVTVSGLTTIYYMPTNQTTCLSSCPDGEFADSGTPNTCSPCSSECTTCSGSATSCTGNACQANYYFYNNACVSSCPNSTYTFNGQCLSECPSGYQGSIGSISTCVVCTATTCTNSFTVSTKVVNGGNNFEHKVDLPNGLSSSSTADAIKNGVSVTLTTGTARMLVSTVTLSVQSVSISGNRDFLTILTNYQAVNIQTSSILVNFQAGTLISSSGSSYSQLSGTVSFNTPAFLNSYYEFFSSNNSLQIEGIVFVLLSFVLFLCSIPLKNKKLVAECLAFIGMVQIFGLARVRGASYDFEFFDSLKGYSMFELRFIKNHFATPFTNNNYSQVAEDSAVFAFGTQNFIINFGSIFYFLLAFQLLLMIYFCYLKYKETKGYQNDENDDEQENQDEGKSGKQKRFLLFWELQFYLLAFWSCILIYGSGLCLMSLQNNTVSSSNLQYSFTILTSFLIVLGYSFYYVVKVWNQIKISLFEIHNLFRIFGLLLLAAEYNSGLILINFAELFFLVVEITFYRDEKIYFSFFMIERLAFWFAFNTALLKVASIPLLAIAGIFFSIITMIKFYYFGKVLFESCQVFQEEEEGIPEQSDLAHEGRRKRKLFSQNSSIHEVIERSRKSNLEVNKMESNNTLLDPPSIVTLEQKNEPKEQHQKLPQQIEEWNDEDFEPDVKRVVTKRRNKRMPEPIKVIESNSLDGQSLEEVKVVPENYSNKPERMLSRRNQLYEIDIEDSSENSEPLTPYNPNEKPHSNLVWKDEVQDLDN